MYIHIYIYIYVYGGFLKQGYPPIIHVNGIFQYNYKPSFLGVPHFWKPNENISPLRLALGRDLWSRGNGPISPLKKCQIWMSLKEMNASRFGCHVHS